MKLIRHFAISVASVALLSVAALADKWVESSTTIERSAMSEAQACSQVEAAVADFNSGEKRLISSTPCKCRQLQDAWYSCSSFVRYKIHMLTND